ncbi:MAG: serine hydroxymethyltransferase [Thermoplasmata archaeon]|nr:MAG: serine hydroxymethyltransferase [Thermoplasmata archaeon]
MEKNEMMDLIKKHEEYRLSGINLISSENRMNERALVALSSDLAGRYGDKWYGGSEYSIKIYENVIKLTKKLFKVRHAIVTPLSGNLCNLAVIFSFSKPGDKIAGIPKEKGGYPFGYEKFNRKLYKISMRGYEIDVEKIRRQDVSFVLLASSIFLFPHPVKKISEIFDSIIVYDASHVLGLIAGGEFQQPFKEGASVVIGSTHKTFPGPQGGIVLINDDAINEKLEEYLLFNFDAGIGLIDNMHINRIASLGIVMEEMIEKGKNYAKQTIKNAKRLASFLHENGLRVKYPEKGYTESHQILLDMNKKQAYKFFKELEKNKIFIDCIGRIGVAEATHIGMKEKEMDEIAEMMIDVHEGKNVKKRAMELAMRFYY